MSLAIMPAQTGVTTFIWQFSRDMLAGVTGQ
jgi:hypothetical protein